MVVRYDDRRGIGPGPRSSWHVLGSVGSVRDSTDLRNVEGVYNVHAAIYRPPFAGSLTVSPVVVVAVFSWLPGELYGENEQLPLFM